MPGRWDGEYGPVPGEWGGAIERTDRAAFPTERRGIESLRPALRQVSEQAAADPRCQGQFVRVGENWDRRGKVVQPRIMIDVHMGQNDGPHLPRIEAQRPQPRADPLQVRWRTA